MSLNWVDDPYSDFLDLPAGERPPQFYQLLELEIFCAHRERIEQAARKQFRKVKPYQEHPDRKMREAIQDVITQIARARVVLTDPEKKEDYDCALAQRLGIDRAGVLASRMATPVPEFALTITAGPTDVGNTIELLADTRVTVGRDPHCVILLHSLRLAKLHGELRHQHGRWSYTHVARDGLTLINEQRVVEKELEAGDRIEAGGYVLRFRRLTDLGKEPGSYQPPITLIVIRGPSLPDASCSAVGGERFLIGSCETALWQLAGPWVSRHHCRMEFEAKRWVVTDLRSTHGTMLNGKRVARSPVQDRDTLSIGRFEVMARLHS
ncbi:MAG: FHA domain-containing protein [Phycisphaerae bacterium]|nr:FHA domain-containing protein [Phycisphaerae bacterium]